jgi:hypothetical protein
MPNLPDIFFDNDGLIVHRHNGNDDGGDTAQREGWYWFGVWVRQHIINDPWNIPRTLTFPEVLRLLEPRGDGIFYRHPKLPPWNNPYDDHYGFSRDQMVPLVAAMGVWGYTDIVRRLWNALIQDVIGGTKHTFNGHWIEVAGFKTIYTGDVVTPQTINLFRRAWGEDPSLAGDGTGPTGEKELAANVGLRLPPALSDRDDTGDDLNLIVMLLMANLRFPFAGSTDIPSTSQQITAYSKNRLVSYGSFVDAYRNQFGVSPTEILLSNEVKQRLDAGIASGWLTDCSRVYGAVRWYHRQSTGANPLLAELYRPIIRAYLE